MASTPGPSAAPRGGSLPDIVLASPQLHLLISFLSPPGYGEGELWAHVRSHRPVGYPFLKSSNNTPAHEIPMSRNQSKMEVKIRTSPHLRRRSFVIFIICDPEDYVKLFFKSLQKLIHRMGVSSPEEFIHRPDSLIDLGLTVGACSPLGIWVPAGGIVTVRIG